MSTAVGFLLVSACVTAGQGESFVSEGAGCLVLGPGACAAAPHRNRKHHAHGLLSFLRLLRAFQLNAIKRNHVYYQQQSGFLGSLGQHFIFFAFFRPGLIPGLLAPSGLEVTIIVPMAAITPFIAPQARVDRSAAWRLARSTEREAEKSDGEVRFCARPS